MAKNMVYLTKYTMWTSAKYVFCCWTENSTNTNQVKEVKNVVQVYYILVDFCPLIPSIIKTGIEISDYNCRFVSFSFQLYQILLHVFLKLCY